MQALPAEFGAAAGVPRFWFSNSLPPSASTAVSDADPPDAADGNTERSASAFGHDPAQLHHAQPPANMHRQDENLSMPDADLHVGGNGQALESQGLRHEGLCNVSTNVRTRPSGTGPQQPGRIHSSVTPQPGRSLASVNPQHKAAQRELTIQHVMPFENVYSGASDFLHDHPQKEAK